MTNLNVPVPYWLVSRPRWMMFWQRLKRAWSGMAVCVCEIDSVIGLIPVLQY